jgi:hypothetical protein
MRAVRPENSIIEQARLRRRKPAKLYDFNALFDRRRTREPPQYCRRADDVCLFYHGKENAIYGETEAGKDMLLAETVLQAMEDSKIIAWIDFEEGDEIDTGSRLLQMGVSPDTLCDQDMFRFSTPEDVEAARNSIHDAKTHGCDLVIFNGLQAMYGLFGWELYDPSSPALFRQMISPLLKSGRTVIETDHMTKTSAEGKNGSRYAAGGIAKLNWINGAAYIIEAVDPIIMGSVGRSKVILTKDRPGGVKPHCAKIAREPRMMFAGTLVVKSTGDDKGNWSLRVDIVAPEAGSEVKDTKARASRSANGQQPIDNDVPTDILKKVLKLYEDCGPQGASKADIERLYKGNGARYVRVAIQILVTRKCLVKAGKSATSNIAPLRYEKDYEPDE